MKNFLKKYRFYLIAIFCLLIFIISFYLNKGQFEKAVMNNYNHLDFKCDESCLIGGEFIEIKDKKVYYNSVLVKGADLKTFKKIHWAFAIDKNNVYFRDYNSKYDDDYNKKQKIGYFMKKISGIDYETFEIINRSGYFIKDKYNVFYDKKLIKGADPVSFEFLGNNYSKDKNNIYFKIDLVNEADLKTFKLVRDYYDEWGYAKDKNNCYSYGKIVDMSKCEKIERESNEK